MSSFNKFGIIIVVPNYIISSGKSFNDKVLDLIEEYMEIEVWKCDVSFKECFEDATTSVRLTSTKLVKGLMNCGPFGVIPQKRFPIEALYEI